MLDREQVLVEFQREMGQAQIVGLVELVEREGTVKQEGLVELVKLAVLEDTVLLD